jgi:hypothetical protein
MARVLIYFMGLLMNSEHGDGNARTVKSQMGTGLFHSAQTSVRIVSGNM